MLRKKECVAIKIEKEQLSFSTKSCEVVLFRNSSAYITFFTSFFIVEIRYDKIFMNLYKSSGGQK